MKMDTMNRLFEARGFEVDRRWENDRYRFFIRKNGFIFSDTFKYPWSTDAITAEEHQVFFVDHMIKNFNDMFREHINQYTDSYLPKRDLTLRTNIKNVIFNNPVVVITWWDGTKTVVKSEGEDYDPEKGLAMAIAKKALGNEGNYYNVSKKWLPKNEDAEIIYKCRNCIYRKCYNEGEPCQGCNPDNGNKFFIPATKYTGNSVKCRNCEYWAEDVDGCHCISCIGIPNHPNFVMRKGGNK